MYSCSSPTQSGCVEVTFLLQNIWNIAIGNWTKQRRVSFSSVNCSCSCCECTANALTRDRVETRSVACIRFIVNQRNVGKHCCNLQCIGAMELQSTVVVRTYSFKLDFPSLCSRIYFQQPLNNFVCNSWMKLILKQICKKWKIWQIYLCYSFRGGGNFWIVHG